MHKRQEMGNLFMKSNPKPIRKMPPQQNDLIDGPLPPPQRKQVNLNQAPFEFRNGGRNESEQIYRNTSNNTNIMSQSMNDFNNHRNNMTQSMEFNDQYYEMKNYNPSFYSNNNNNNNNNNRILNNSNKSDRSNRWMDDDDEIEELEEENDEKQMKEDKEESKLIQSQKSVQINHPTKKFYKNPKFNFNEKQKPVEVPVVETRQRVIFQFLYKPLKFLIIFFPSNFIGN